MRTGNQRTLLLADLANPRLHTGLFVLVAEKCPEGFFPSGRACDRTAQLSNIQILRTYVFPIELFL